MSFAREGGRRSVMDRVLEVRRTMNGWIVEYPGGEDCFADGQGGGYHLGLAATEVSYEFTEEQGELVIRLSHPVAIENAQRRSAGRTEREGGEG